MLETRNKGLEASCALREAELKCMTEEVEELKAFKTASEDRIKDLEGQVETLTVEAMQAEVGMRTFTLEQVSKGSLTPELAKKELDTMAVLQNVVDSFV